MVLDYIFHFIFFFCLVSLEEEQYYEKFFFCDSSLPLVLKEWRQFKRKVPPTCFDSIPLNNVDISFTAR